MSPRILPDVVSTTAPGLVSIARPVPNMVRPAAVTPRNRRRSIFDCDIQYVLLRFKRPIVYHALDIEQPSRLNSTVEALFGQRFSLEAVEHVVFDPLFIPPFGRIYRHAMQKQTKVQVVSGRETGCAAPAN